MTAKECHYRNYNTGSRTMEKLVPSNNPRKRGTTLTEEDRQKIVATVSVMEEHCLRRNDQIMRVDVSIQTVDTDGRILPSLLAEKFGIDFAREDQYEPAKIAEELRKMANMIDKAVEKIQQGIDT